jgi:carnitine 3-dehydrogenase
VARVEPNAAERVCCIGTGVIGGGWVALFLARGLDVTVWDPAPDAEPRLRELIARAWPSLSELGLVEGASPERWRVAETVAEAVEGAQFVQESAPERLALKQDLLAEIDAAAEPDVVIASSTSNLLVVDMAAKAARPERIVAGHPYNPSYLIPLVEVVGGPKTDRAAVEWAAAFYDHLGKYSILMEREVAGFIANQLQAALSREVTRMWLAGEATIEQIDDAISEGPGLRWALFGPSMAYHLASSGGIRGSIAHFGREFHEAETEEQFVAEVEALARGRSVAELEVERDAKLVAILKAKGGQPAS